MSERRDAEMHFGEIEGADLDQEELNRDDEEDPFALELWLHKY